MTSLQLILGLIACPLGIVLFRDFMAGLAEERIWADPSRTENS